ncbi:hypothetical protein C8Q76DRAFT_660872 [Earliella scabrosa]|nr:hypothetical protein C8Q76DRAFT_660872 [Earliella scabrosa]
MYRHAPASALASTKNVHSTSSPSGTPLDQLSRCEEFWLEDGNLVLVARDTVFRVYRQLLASQSPIFADMFASSSVEASETLDGCPVVRLSDSPQDLVHLLRVLLPRTQRSVYRDNEVPPMTFNQISAMVRLAHKYGIEDVQRQALSALKADLTEFSRFYEGEGAAVIYDETVWKGEEGPRRGLTESSSQAIGIVSLARLTDTPSLLPVALYICATLGNSMLNGWKREDGTIEHLSEEDLRLCINGCYALSRRALEMLGNIFVPSSSCCSPPGCETNLSLAFAEAARNSYDAYSPYILVPFTDSVDSTLEAFELCSACARELPIRELATRKDAWDKLPGLFNLVIEGWGSKTTQ